MFRAAHAIQDSPSEALGLLVQPVHAVCGLCDLCGGRLSWLSDFSGGSPAVRRADDQTLLRQEMHEVRGAGRFREFEWRYGLRREATGRDLFLELFFLFLSLSH